MVWNSWSWSIYFPTFNWSTRHRWTEGRSLKYHQKSSNTPRSVRNQTGDSQHKQMNKSIILNSGVLEPKRKHITGNANNLKGIVCVRIKNKWQIIALHSEYTHVDLSNSLAPYSLRIGNLARLSLIFNPFATLHPHLSFSFHDGYTKTKIFQMEPPAVYPYTYPFITFHLEEDLEKLSLDRF